jgi:hypothetical protein
MNDFKFNYYLNLYKEKSLPNRDEFRKNFKKKHGKYNKLEELIISIENYQFKKYGQTLNSHFAYNPKRFEKINMSIAAYKRRKRRMSND